jgi:hypothetical protein
VYVPHTQRAWNALTVVVRTRTDPRTLLTSVRDAIWLIDKKLPLASVQTMQQVMDTEMARPRLTMFLLVLFGLAALALTRVLASLLFDVNAADPGVFGAAALLLLGVVVAAACIPAFRASRIDLVTTLRCE